MSRLTWQKSSFSGGGEGECVELASGTTGHIHLRESDTPARVATTTATPLHALLTTLKEGDLTPRQGR